MDKILTLIAPRGALSPDHLAKASAALRAAGVRLCVGIDSHVVTDPVEEMRKWWSDTGALVRVTGAEERGECLFWRRRAG